MSVVLEQLKDDLPSALVDLDAYDRIAAVAAILPERLSTFWGLECHLGEPEAAADILFEIRNKSRGLAALAGYADSNLNELCTIHPAWKTLREFARHWTDKDHLFHSHIYNMWLEFDVARATTPRSLQHAMLQPNFFFGPERTNATPEELVAIISEIMHLFGRSMPPLQQLRAFTSTLPVNARLFQIGLMLTRENDHGLRLCVNNLETNQIPAWLSGLGIGGHDNAVSALLNELSPLIDHCCIDLNLTGQGVDCTFGIECYTKERNDTPDQWIPLLEYLCSRGLCLPQKKSATVSFPGITDVPLHSRVDREIVYINPVRSINHCKITVVDGRAAQAKVYLAVKRHGMSAELLNFHNQQNTPSDQAWNIH